MNTRIASDLNRYRPRTYAMGELIDQAGYPILALVSLWASARFSDYSEQFLTLAIILGWRWICGSGTQVIQIFTHDERL